VETDSMGPPPSDNSADQNYKERNFIRGRVTAIGDIKSFAQSGGRKPTRLTLLPEATPPALGLSDISKDLSKQGADFGCGRFEHGAIRIGVGNQAAAVADLDGNGTDFVQKVGADPCPGNRKGGLTIPFTLVDASGGNALTGSILEWDSQTKEITLSSAVGRPIYDGGKLTVGGVTWTVQSARGPRATVIEDQPLPFELVDDDDATHPFTFSTSLLQISDDPTANLYAQAYLRPRYDVTDVKQAPFNRNISSPIIDTNPDGTPIRDSREFKEQLALGRDSAVSTVGYWTVYVQGGFQGDESGDRDPNSESQGAAGESLGDDDRYGIFLYMEVIRDSVLRGDAGVERCSSRTFVHEIGHQFGLEDGSGGLMSGTCLSDAKYFTDAALATIRSKGATK